MGSIQYQIHELNDIAEVQVLNFDDFFVHHDDFSIEKPHGTIRDGSVVRYEAHVPLFGNKSILEIDFLSPFWEALFRVRFIGVEKVIYDHEHFRFPDIKSIKLSLVDKGRKEFCITSFYDKVIGIITFKSATLKKIVLNKPLTRKLLMEYASNN